MTDWKDRLTKAARARAQAGRPASGNQRLPRHAVRHLPLPAGRGVRRAAGNRAAAHPPGAGRQARDFDLSAACLYEALEAEGLGTEALAEAEKSVGLESTIETIHQVLSEYRPLDELVAARIPDDADPLRDVVFIVRAGALFPIYRTSSLLEQLKGKVHVPAVLFYPGELDGAAGLRFMGVLDAEHNYRPKIF